VRLSVCPPAFSQATVCADWNWGLCDTPFSACISFNASSGFEAFQLTASEIALFENILGVGATLDIQIVYALDDKTVTPTLRFDPHWIICPEIVFLGEAVLTAPDPGISAIRIYGATVEVPIGDAVFRVADSFSDDKNASVVGKAAFFESFSLETSLASCCGSPGRLKGSVYFERSPAPSGGLFGVGLLEGLAEFQISPNVAAAFTVEFPPTDPVLGAHGPAAGPVVAAGATTIRATFLTQKLPADAAPYSSLPTRPSSGRTTTRKPSFHAGTATPSSA
jgi:hypothetical protein